jgi:hypothetical protein
MRIDLRHLADRGVWLHVVMQDLLGLLQACGGNKCYGRSHVRPDSLPLEHRVWLCVW